VPDITSRQHPIVKAFRAAARGNDTRALVDGWHLLHEAAAASMNIETVAYTGQPRAGNDRSLLDRLSRVRTTEVISVSPSVMDALSPVRTPAGVVALVERKHAQLEDLLQPAPALIIMASDLQDPGNAGAIIRAAEAGGATGVIFAGASADPWNWKALRAAMGSTFRVPVVQQATAGDMFKRLRERGVRLVATVPTGGVMMYDADLRGPTALLVGSEGAGVDPALLQSADLTLSIPMQGAVESLNVAVAVGVLVYEARRQRGTIGGTHSS
jgi:TrmH family RNA methyltransferase